MAVFFFENESGDPELDFWFWSYLGPGQFCDVNVNGQTLTRFSYSNTNWTFLQLPLDTFAGQMVTIEFRFDSTSGTAYSRDGVFVDDISISGGP